jgi:hypothetical protein
MGLAPTAANCPEIKELIQPRSSIHRGNPAGRMPAGSPNGARILPHRPGLPTHLFALLHLRLRIV